MKIKKPIIIFSITALSLSMRAWGLDKEINVQNILTGSLSNSQKSEKLVEAAEEFVFTPYFFYSADILKQALQFNPNNVKARAYSALLAPAMANKGIYKRIEPLESQLTAKQKKDIDKTIAGIPEGPTRQFLFDGDADISTISQLQKHLSHVAQILDKSRQIIKSLSSSNLVMRPEMNTNVSTDEVLRKCSVREVQPNVFTTNGCHLLKRTVMKIDYADWAGFNLILAYAEVQALASNGYDMTGINLVAARYEKKPKPTQAEIISLVNRQHDLGYLKDALSLKSVLAIGHEAVELLKGITANKNSICSKDRLAGEFRPSRLFESICPDDTVKNKLPFFESLVTGPTRMALKVYSEYQGVRWQSGKYVTTVDVTKPAGGSVQNLQSLLPTTFDACGNATSIPDRSVGGMFPRNDGDIAIRAHWPTFLNESCEPTSLNALARRPSLPIATRKNQMISGQK